jgi:aspartoacylase
MISQLSIIGGTHGNERIGISLIDYWKENPKHISYSSFQTALHFGNPRAIAENKRFIDHDLNRCFLKKELTDKSLQSYEQKRAKELYQQLDQGNSANSNFIIDIHSSTSEMGITFIIEYNDLATLRLAASVQLVFPEIKILFSNISVEIDLPFLYTINKRGILLELGAVANGVLNHDLYIKARNITERLIKHIDLLYRNKLSFPTEADVYIPYKSILYPTNKKGEPIAMIHKFLQGNDYKILKNNDPIFFGFDDNVYTYSGDSAYPVFINEAAYCKEGIAFQLSKKETINLKGDF